MRWRYYDRADALKTLREEAKTFFQSVLGKAKSEEKLDFVVKHREFIESQEGIPILMAEFPTGGLILRSFTVFFSPLEVQDSAFLPLLIAATYNRNPQEYLYFHIVDKFGANLPALPRRLRPNLAHLSPALGED